MKLKKMIGWGITGLSIAVFVWGYVQVAPNSTPMVEEWLIMGVALVVGAVGVIIALWGQERQDKPGYWAKKLGRG